MRSLLERLVMVMTLSFVAISVAHTMAVAQGGPSTLVFAGLAALAVTAVLAARYAAVVIRTQHVGVGERARQHRQSLVGMPEPQHPDTAGRPRSRAPSRAPAVA